MKPGQLADGVLELIGESKSGTTTMALCMAAAVQRAGGRVAYLDLDESLDLDRAKQLHVDGSAMMVCVPPNMEKALCWAGDMVLTGEVRLVVIDCMRGMVPAREIGGEIEGMPVGWRQKFIAETMIKLDSMARKEGCAVLVIKQRGGRS